jgi:hypothetical protein
MVIIQEKETKYLEEHDRVIVTQERIWRCDCGEEVYLDRFTNTCYGCGSDYSMSGELLAPREQWGAETGEHWTDCV